MILAMAVVGCSRSPAPATRAETSRAPTGPAANTTSPVPPPLVVAARRQIGVTVRYDPSYVRLPYPNGDVPSDRGVCTDVVIRAFRVQGIDLQQRVHEDMRANFASYPRLWGLRAPDSNIDHRRVPNLQRWFERQQWAQSISDQGTAYQAGDLVTWDLGDSVPHIGIVSERHSIFGPPLVIHNIGAGTREENILFRYRITGQYRPPSTFQRSVSSRE